MSRSDADSSGKVRYLNRELSWVAFNARVLALAEDRSRPLLERLKFLAIVSSNFDEFFQVRVAGLKEQLATGVVVLSPDGLTPLEQLEAIRVFAGELVERQTRVLLQEILPELAEAGVEVTSWAQLNDEERAFLSRHFRERTFPVLTPLSVDPAHPFPHISNLSVNLAVVVRDREAGTTRFARVKVPALLPRFVHVDDGTRFVPLEQIIAAHLHELFPGMEVVSHHLFRPTRNADLDLEEDEGADLLDTIEAVLRRRRLDPMVVRLEVERGMPEHLLVAPATLRTRLIELIRREAGRGAEGRIVLKMNSLVDTEIIDAFYEASQAGTDIDLVVRSICCLQPGVGGLSENIRVRSSVGRYLEHSRIFRFGSRSGAGDLEGGPTTTSGPRT
ncbi:MAG TPA: hypothetical protein VII47_01865 [Actinomycetota bacterium]